MSGQLVRFSLWGELFRSRNDQITVLQLVGFAQQEVAEKLLKGGKIRLNAAGIVAIVCTDKGIAKIPGTCFCVKVRLLSIKSVTKIYHLHPKAFFEKKE